MSEPMDRRSLLASVAAVAGAALASTAPPDATPQEPPVALSWRIEPGETVFLELPEGATFHPALRDGLSRQLAEILPGVKFIVLPPGVKVARVERAATLYGRPIVFSEPTP